MFLLSVQLSVGNSWHKKTKTLTRALISLEEPKIIRTAFRIIENFFKSKEKISIKL